LNIIALNDNDKYKTHRDVKVNISLYNGDDVCMDWTAIVWY
jgi:hypothetical protein